MYGRLGAMNWLGKLVGFLLGALIFGPIGALLGIFFGHLYDKASSTPKLHKLHTEAQQAFFDTTFNVMGHIAKADGRVSEDEIRVARAIMDRIGLNELQRKEAIHQFSRGKQSDFSLDANLRYMMRLCQQHRNLLKMFVEIQIQAAYATGIASPKQQTILQTICNILGMTPLNFTLLNMMYGRGQTGYQHYSYQQHHRAQQTQQTPLSECYALLEVDPKANKQEIKKAYRKAMSANHPDKLVAKGLPEEMVKIATEKTQRIQKAYEQICQQRGF